MQNNIIALLVKFKHHSDKSKEMFQTQCVYIQIQKTKFCLANTYKTHIDLNYLSKARCLKQFFISIIRMQSPFKYF